VRAKAMPKIKSPIGKREFRLASTNDVMKHNKIITDVFKRRQQLNPANEFSHGRMKLKLRKTKKSIRRNEKTRTVEVES
jgi:hypothetical protein